MSDATSPKTRAQKTLERYFALSMGVRQFGMSNCLEALKLSTYENPPAPILRAMTRVIEDAAARGSVLMEPDEGAPDPSGITRENTAI
jgi:hypothetical protein